MRGKIGNLVTFNNLLEICYFDGNHAKILLAKKKASNDYFCPLVDCDTLGLYQLPKMFGTSPVIKILLFLIAAKLLSVQNCSLHQRC